MNKLSTAQRDSIHAAIANFLAEIAKEFENVPGHIQEYMEEEYIADEEWDALLNNIEAALNGKIFVEE
jgi:hypothetical protein